MLMTMFVLTMTLVTTVIVRLTGSFKKMLSKMITRDRKKDFVIFASEFAISQTEYLVRKKRSSAQLYYECDEI